ncbi:hypothetical protein BGX38DRAFT_1146740 [Terfezia claveryi]|nr:hypothetical protein BGX38DRAFT_1146740 [Terfezia claveryi]
MVFIRPDSSGLAALAWRDSIWDFVHPHLPVPDLILDQSPGFSVLYVIVAVRIGARATSYGYDQRTISMLSIYGKIFWTALDSCTPYETQEFGVWFSSSPGRVVTGFDVTITPIHSNYTKYVEWSYQYVLVSVVDRAPERSDLSLSHAAGLCTPPGSSDSRLSPIAYPSFLGDRCNSLIGTTEHSDETGPVLQFHINLKRGAVHMQ